MYMYVDIHVHMYPLQKNGCHGSLFEKFLSSSPVEECEINGFVGNIIGPFKYLTLQLDC